MTAEKSRGELLSWLNSLLKINLSKIQHLGTGSVYCQLFDIVHPGKISMSKVNWKAKQQYEYVNNFKVLQQGFIKLKIQRHVDVERLIKCKYNDNLQFLQWFIKTFDFSNTDPEAIAKRTIQFQAPPEQQRKPTVRRDTLLIPRNPSYIQRSVQRQKPQRLSVCSNRHTEKENSVTYDRQNEELSLQRPIFNKQFNKLKNQRNFYYKKLMEIDHLVDLWEAKQSEGSLIVQLRKILLCPPERIPSVQKDGTVVETLVQNNSQ